MRLCCWTRWCACDCPTVSHFLSGCCLAEGLVCRLWISIHLKSIEISLKKVIFLNISSIKFQHKKGHVVQTSKKSIVNKFIKKYLEYPNCRHMFQESVKNNFQTITYQFGVWLSNVVIVLKWATLLARPRVSYASNVCVLFLNYNFTELWARLCLTRDCLNSL